MFHISDLLCLVRYLSCVRVMIRLLNMDGPRHGIASLTDHLESTTIVLRHRSDKRLVPRYRVHPVEEVILRRLSLYGFVVVDHAMLSVTAAAAAMVTETGVNIVNEISGRIL